MMDQSQNQTHQATQALGLQPGIDQGRAKLGRAVYLLVQWGREARARRAEQQRDQAAGESSEADA
jgi:hypothetical protein